MDDYKKTVQKEFGIDSKKEYSGDLVADLIAVCLEEKDRAIEEAYEEGFKKAAEEYKPDLEYYKYKANNLQIKFDTLQAENDKLFRNNLAHNFTSFSIGLISGLVTGGYIGYKIDF